MLAAETADQIILHAGFTEGYCLDLACGDGSLAFALVALVLFVGACSDDPAEVPFPPQPLPQRN